MSQDSSHVFGSQDSDLSVLPFADLEQDDDPDGIPTGNDLDDPRRSRARFIGFREQSLANPALVRTNQCFPYERGMRGDRANGVHFVELIKLSNAMRWEQRAKRRTEMLEHFMREHGLFEHGQLVYPFLRLLLPEQDAHRNRYFIKEKTLAQMYKQALGLPETLALRLERYNDPSLNTTRFLNELTGTEVQVMNGRFPSVLRDVLQVFFNRNFGNIGVSTCSLTCGEMNNYLDQIHDATGLSQKSRVLRDLIFDRKLQTAAAHEYLSRVILKCVSCIDTSSALLAYHTDAQTGNHVLGDLRRVLALCIPGRQTSFKYELFSPGRPMLASRTRIDLATTKLGDFIIEEKMDGDRMIVHLDRTTRKFRLFTRNQKDFTNVYGAPELIASLFQTFDCEQCILDGEMVPFDGIKGDVIRCGRCINLQVAQEMYRAKRESPIKRFLCFFAFDIMLLKESSNSPVRDLTDLPLWERKAILTRLFRPSQSPQTYVRLVRPMQVVRDCTDLDARHSKVMEQLDWIIAAKREGLVLKSLDAPYSLTGRSPLWIKVKPDYVRPFAEGLDCIVLGGEYFKDSIDRVFHGVHQVSKLLFGLRYPRPTKDGYNYRAFCLTGIGLTNQEFRFIHRVFEQKGILSSEQKPPHFRWTGCPIWLKPEDSFIVEVTGTQMFERFRFPYIRGVRHDKNWDECATVEECDERFQQGYLFSAVRAADIKRADFQGKKASHRSDETSEPTEEAVNESNIFGEKTFLVFAGDYPYANLSSKPEVERLIRKHGGMVREFKDGFRADVYIAADRDNIRVRNVIRSKQSCPQILSVHYLLSCLEEGHMMPPGAFQHVIYPGHTLAERKRPRLQHPEPEFDAFGDAYTEEATLETLVLSLHRVPASCFVEPQFPFSQEEEELLLPSACKYFAGMRVHFDDDCRKETQVIVQLYGGDIVTTLVGETPTHHVVTSPELLRAEIDMQEGPRIVPEEWIFSTLRDCQARQKMWFHV